MENNQTNPTQQEQTTNPNIEVSVRPISPQGKVYAYADVTVGGLKQFGFPVKLNNSGELYTDMPGGYDKDGKWQDHCKPVSSEAYQQINKAVLAQYMQEIENMRNTLEATTQQVSEPEKAPQPKQQTSEKAVTAATATRSSVSENLKNAVAQSKAQPVKPELPRNAELGG